MKKAIFDGTDELKVVDADIPAISVDEVLIKVDSATICGTDVHILQGEYDAAKYISLGHEFSGYVDKVGSNVTACKVGDLVSVEPHKYCGICKFCRIGKEHLCLNKKAFGVHLDGGFSQYVAVPEFTVYKVPKGISAEEAALCETLGCCLHGMDRVNMTVGDDVVILGGGVIGIMLLKLSRLCGAASVTVSEPMAERRAMALHFGADRVVNPSEEDLAQIVMDHTDGLGVDIVFEAVGRPDTYGQAFRIVGRGGKVVFFGVAPPDVEISVNPNDIYKRELTVLGSAINPDTHHRILRMMGQLDVSGLITHRFPLERINDALSIARKSQGLKICIKPNL